MFRRKADHMRLRAIEKRVNRNKSDWYGFEPAGSKLYWRSPRCRQLKEEIRGGVFTIPKCNSYGHIQYIQLNEENFLFVRALRLGEETKTD